VIGATAARSTGGAKKKERRFRTEKRNRSFLFNNFPVEINTFVANKCTSGPCNEPFYLVLLFAAERATIGESCFVHALISPLRELAHSKADTIDRVVERGIKGFSSPHHCFFVRSYLISNCGINANHAKPSPLGMGKRLPLLVEHYGTDNIGKDKIVS